MFFMITVIKLHHSECVFGCKMVNEFATKCETLLSILEYRPSCNRGWASKQTYYLLKKAISLKISGTVPKGLSQDSDYSYTSRVPIGRVDGGAGEPTFIGHICC